MTAEQIGDRYGDPVVHCVWFDGKTLKRDSFPPTALELLRDEP